MGHPIDPGDPANGGCNLCLSYIPHALHMTYWWIHDNPYTGTIRKDPIEHAVWHGQLSDGEHVDRHGGVQFCARPSGVAIVNFVGAWNTEIADIHCNLPIAAQNQDGFDFLITAEH